MAAAFVGAELHSRSTKPPGTRRSRNVAQRSARSGSAARQRASAASQSARWVRERADLVGDQERGRLGPAERALGAEHLFGSQRLAVRVRRVLLVRRAVADVAPADDERGPRGLGDRLLQRLRHLVVVERVGAQHLPAVGLEALRRVVAERDAGRPVDGDVVVVVHHHQVAELEMARERRGLVRDALHHAAVAGDREHAVLAGREPGATRHVEGGRSEARVLHARGERHADGVRDPLAERARRRLDARRVPILRMPGRAAPELAEALELVHRQVVAREVEQRVEQHRAVAGGEHEPVATGPGGIARVEPEVARPQDVRRIRHAHGHARVARARLLDRVHGEEPDRVRGLRGQRRVGAGRSAHAGDTTLAAPRRATYARRVTSRRAEPS